VVTRNVKVISTDLEQGFKLVVTAIFDRLIKHVSFPFCALEKVTRPF